MQILVIFTIITNTIIFLTDAVDKWEECMRRNIGRKLKLLRYNRFGEALHLKDVCKNLSVPFQKIELANIEKGKAGSRNEKLFALLEFYNISFDWLINGDERDVLEGKDIPPFDYKSAGLADSISEKIKRIIHSDDYIIVDSKGIFLYGGIGITAQHHRQMINKKRAHNRLITLVRFAYIYNISVSWLFYGDIQDIDNQSIPEFEAPRMLRCQEC